MTTETIFRFEPRHLTSLLEEHEARFWLDQHLGAMSSKFSQMVPARFADATATHPEVIDWVAEVCAAATMTVGGPLMRRGPSLLLLGPTGVGKTFQAWGALRALTATGARFGAQFVAAADLYAELRPRYGVDSEEVYRAYSRADVLVVDDLGAAKHSEWVEEVNQRLVNYRYERQLTSVFTSNVKPADLAARLGERVASRLREMCSVHALKGEDRRSAP